MLIKRLCFNKVLSIRGAICWAITLLIFNMHIYCLIILVFTYYNFFNLIGSKWPHWYHFDYLLFLSSQLFFIILLIFFKCNYKSILNNLKFIFKIYAGHSLFTMLCKLRLSASGVSLWDFVLHLLYLNYLFFSFLIFVTVILFLEIHFEIPDEWLLI